MAAKRTKAPAEEKAEAPAPAEHPTGWAHDWRNPDAKFAAGDECLEARMARMARR